MLKSTAQGSCASIRTQSGLGLIEVLIAVLVLAVGILGLASMQLNAKRASFEASQRSLATSFARDILERIRSNPSEAGTYDTAVTELNVDSYTEASPSGVNCSSATCTLTSDLAEYDVWDWVRMVRGEQIKLGTTAAGGLLNAFVCINATQVTNTAGIVIGNTVEVIISWKGVSELDPSGINADAGPPIRRSCGEGQNVYENDAGTDAVLRRQLTITTFVADI